MNVFSHAVPPFYKNGFVVSCEDTGEAIVIDPGDEVDVLISHVAASGVDVKAILLTHAHLDHISGVADIKAVCPVPTWLHPADLFLYEGVVEQGRLFGLDMTPQPRVEAFFEPGRPFTFGRYVVDIHHTPGHCPGGVSLAIGRAGLPDRELFVGDTLFAGGIGRTDLPGGDYDTLVAAIRNVLFAFPDDALVRPGHGPNTTIGRERRTNPFLV